MAQFSLSNIDPLRVLAVDCVVRLHAFIKFSMKMGLPVIVLFLLYVMYQINKCMHVRGLRKFQKRCLRCGGALREDLKTASTVGTCEHPRRTCKVSRRKANPQVRAAMMGHNLVVFRCRVSRRLNFAILTNKLFRLFYWLVRYWRSGMSSNSAFLSHTHTTSSS
jgi:hypothetical protein